jgi:hypothetical protein
MYRVDMLYDVAFMLLLRVSSWSKYVIKVCKVSLGCLLIEEIKFRYEEGMLLIKWSTASSSDNAAPMIVIVDKMPCARLHRGYYDNGEIQQSIHETDTEICKKKWT